ncbi:hypothetical protein N7540_011866 [Penicillium herquei]|nr:hypothetical protein N7540_011866 [Penicillium herquei]
MPLYTRRASKACVWCHERKVRCDALALGCPCTRCRQDNRPCKMRRKVTARSRFTAMTPPRPIPNPSSPIYKAEEFSAIQNLAECSFETDSVHKNHVHFSSYPFLQLEGHEKMSKQDTEFLSSKGCLHVPAAPFLNEFIKQYFLHIQPCTPIVDESIIWDLYHELSGSRSAPGLSLLLFQAMLFASSPYISLETAQSCGFENKRDAWNSFYQRTKQTLYHFQNSQGALTKAQTAILLTFHGSASEPQVASLWLMHAIHAATEATCNDGNRVQEADERKPGSAHCRLWWSILLRDRSLCLGLRRRSQVSSFELSMIVNLPEREYFEDEIAGSEVYDPHTKSMLFDIFRGQCQLAILLTEMASIIFGTHGLSLPMLSFEQFHGTLRTLNRIRASLQLWKDDLMITHFGDLNSHISAKKFLQLTMLYYYTARIDISHYEALLVEKHRDYVGVNYMRQLSYTGNTLLDATTGLITALEYFSEEARVQDLPLAVYDCLVPCCLGHISKSVSDQSCAGLHIS